MAGFRSGATVFDMGRSSVYDTLATAFSNRSNHVNPGSVILRSGGHNPKG